MSFLDPEVQAPYKSLLYPYAEEDQRVDQDAMRRAREFGAQSAASRGSRSPRGTALNTYNRIASDYTTNKAQNERSNRIAYTNSQNAVMRSPGAIQPSGLGLMSSMGGQIGGALLKEAAPDIWKRLKPDSWTGTPQQLSQQYVQNMSAPVANDISGAYQPDYGGMYSGLTNSAYTDLAGGLSPDYFSGAEYASPAAEAATSLWDYDAPFNFDFGNVWGL